MHDSSLADFGVCKKTSNVHKKHDAKVVVDSVLNMPGSLHLIESAQIDPIETAAGSSSNGEGTSLRQMHEWGMQMIQAQFPRMKEPIACKEMGERRLLQHSMVLLHNFQTSTVLINQTLNVCVSQDEDFFSHKNMSSHATALF